MCKRFLLPALCVSAMFYALPVRAGVHSDDLSRCLIESSSAQDKIVLVRWMFTSMSLHPAVEPISSVSREDFEQTSREMAQLFQRLLTEDCNAEAAKAIRYEGMAALGAGFSAFGNVAGQELFAHPKVNAGLSTLTKYLDEQKLQSELGLEPAQ
jgi:hypothetical protein